jgi:hypothetical protein
LLGDLGAVMLDANNNIVGVSQAKDKVFAVDGGLKSVLAEVMSREGDVSPDIKLSLTPGQ